MAKKSARGRTTLAEVSKTVEYTLEQDENVSSRRTTRALMSDGTVLQKTDVVFRPASWEGHAFRRHCYGWTVAARVKGNLSPESWCEAYRTKGFTVRLQLSKVN